MPDTYYDILDVSEDADEDTITHAYRKQVKEYHPDISDHPDAEEKFKKLQRAKDVLTSPKERQRYDDLGHEAYVDNRQRTSSRTSSSSDSSDSTSSTTSTQESTDTTDEAATDTASASKQDTTSTSSSHTTQRATSRKQTNRQARSTTTTTNKHTSTTADSTAETETQQHDSSSREPWSWDDPVTYAVRSGWQERLFLWLITLGAVAGTLYVHTSTMFQLPPIVQSFLSQSLLFSSTETTIVALAGALTGVTLLHQFTITFSLPKGAFDDTVEPPTVPSIWPASVLSTALLTTSVLNGHAFTAASLTTTFSTPAQTLASGPWLNAPAIPTTFTIVLNALLLLVTIATAFWAVIGGLVWLSAHAWNTHHRQGHFILPVFWELGYILPALALIWLAATNTTTITSPLHTASVTTPLLTAALPLLPFLIGVPYRLRIVVEDYLATLDL